MWFWFKTMFFFSEQKFNQLFPRNNRLFMSGKLWMNLFFIFNFGFCDSVKPNDLYGQTCFN